MMPGQSQPGFSSGPMPVPAGAGAPQMGGFPPTASPQAAPAASIHSVLNNGVDTRSMFDINTDIATFN